MSLVLKERNEIMYLCRRSGWPTGKQRKNLATTVQEEDQLVLQTTRRTSHLTLGPVVKDRVVTWAPICLVEKFFTYKDASSALLALEYPPKTFPNLSLENSVVVTNGGWLLHRF